VDDSRLGDLLVELEQTQRRLDEITRKIEKTLDDLQSTSKEPQDAQQSFGSSD
jgi:hypothetical protein